MSDYTPSDVDLAITLITHTTVTSVLYTFSFILYCLCTRLLYKQLSEKLSRQTIFMFALASIMVICATIDVVVKNEYGRIIYVDYSSVPGGPIGLSAQAHAFTLSRIDTVSTLIASFLAMGVLVRRVWVVYTGVPSRFSIPIIILASLVYVAYVVSFIVQAAFAWNPFTGTIGTIDRTLDIVNIFASSMGAASPVIMTLLITMRLMLIRRKHIKLMGQTDIAAQYLGIVTMLVESYALSTAWDIGFVIAYALRNAPAHNFFSLSGFQVQVISYFLLLYRVLSGRAWDRHTRNRITTLRWRCSVQPADDDCRMEVDNRSAACVEAYLSTPSSSTTNV